MKTLQLPRDESAHCCAIEWWYINGHLTVQGNGQEYTFAYALFKFDHNILLLNRLFPRNSHLRQKIQTHFSVLNKESKEFSRKIRDGFFIGPVNRMSRTKLSNTALKSQVVKSSEDSYSLRVRTRAHALALTMKNKKGFLLHGKQGVIRMGESGDSFYYSIPLLSAEGCLNGKKVSGSAWMDHQWGEWDPLGTFWVWFSVQLDNDEQVMIYAFNDEKDRPLQKYGTILKSDGTQTTLADIDLRSTEHWVSPETNISYPMEFRIGFHNHTITIRAVSNNQEIVSSIGQYWEGPGQVRATVGGRPVGGRGFIEMVKKKNGDV